MAVNNFKELFVWQKAMNLTVMVYSLVNKLPSFERYTLADQIRRSAVSIPSNIAEGQQRNSTREFIQFLSIAKGSLGELETQIILCERLNYLSETETEPVKLQCIEIGRMLNGLMKSLQNHS